jgi:hypothetical protein
MHPWSVGILIFGGVEILDFAGPFEVFSRTRLVPGAASRRSEECAVPRLHRGQIASGPAVTTWRRARVRPR